MPKRDVLRVDRTRRRRIRALSITAFSAVALLGVFVATTWDVIVARWEFLRAFEAIGTNPQGCHEFRHRASGIVFVYLPPAVFLMGSPEDEPDRGSKELQHEVRLSGFLIAKHETTQAAWSSVMDDDPSQAKGPEMPVEFISRDRALEFCARAGLTLPTEAQWEYACRGGSEGSFAGPIDEIAWYYESMRGLPPGPRPVGGKVANGFGLHDTHGNVWEWCLDIFDHEFYWQPDASGLDPVCKSGGPSHVIRGGCWETWVGRCRSANRGRLEASAVEVPRTNAQTRTAMQRRSGVGFRAVFDFPPAHPWR
jgi:formylglycine-generating enzyme required for sulfatase activity